MIEVCFLHLLTNHKSPVTSSLLYNFAQLDNVLLALGGPKSAGAGVTYQNVRGENDDVIRMMEDGIQIINYDK